jgi:hypothetical protein
MIFYHIFDQVEKFPPLHYNLEGKDSEENDI